MVNFTDSNKIVLVFIDPENNHYKFYSCEIKKILGEYKIIKRWGRIKQLYNEKIEKAETLEEAKISVLKKIKELKSKGYTENIDDETAELINSTPAALLT